MVSQRWVRGGAERASEDGRRLRGTRRILAPVFFAPLSITLVVLAPLFLTLWGGFGSEARGQTATASLESRAVPGLTANGRILIDRWGIAHIYAQSARDAFFLQGYNVARDRLWQIDLWRKRGLGRLSASFGPAFAAQDEASRLFLYRGDMDAEWAAYPKDARTWTEAFVAGVNAYVAEVRAGSRPLPPEFALTRSAPETWSAQEVVRIRSNALVANLYEEVARARALCAEGAGLEPLRRTLEPPHQIRLPVGLDPCAVPEAVLGVYGLATGGVRFDGRAVVADLRPARGELGAPQEHAEEGSNNWVIGPGRTVTGRPILANDPHREHAVPSLRYLVHLDAPDLHLIGAGEPALPGVSFGHNDDAAWGLTIFPADQQDLYVYALDPKTPDAYLYKGRTERMRLVKETLEVKGEAPRTITLRFTRHGPVIATDPAKGQAFAVRSVWSEPGASAYFNAAFMFRAKTFKDFAAARTRWRTPALNLVYADASGDIGWMAAAAVPVRPNWDGLLPVPGDGRYEWAGLLDPDALPSLKNPAAGVIATANEMNLPKDYPAEARNISFEWTDRSRIDRIQAVLAAKPKLDLLDSLALQTDVHSPLAVRTIALLKGIKGATADERAAIALLTAWDGNETADSGPAALFEIWIARHLRQTAASVLVPEAARAGFNGAATAAINLLQTNAPLLGADKESVRRAILLPSLAAAFREAKGLLGPDPARWRWGDLHRAMFVEGAGALAPDGGGARFGAGPVEVGGSASTPMATAYRGAGFAVAAGASVRIVLDVGAWDNSVAINAPGQSGDPSSPHFKDLFPLWATGAYVPLLYSKAAVAAETERVIELFPPP